MIKLAGHCQNHRNTSQLFSVSASLLSSRWWHLWHSIFILSHYCPSFFMVYRVKEMIETVHWLHHCLRSTTSLELDRVIWAWPFTGVMTFVMIFTYKVVSQIVLKQLHQPALVLYSTWGLATCIYTPTNG